MPNDIFHQKLNSSYELISALKVEDRVNIFQGWFGLYMKATLFIYFQIEGLILIGIRTC